MIRRVPSGLRPAGFTLAEILIAVALTTALVGSVVWLLVYGRGYTARLTPQLALQQNSRKAIVRLLRELLEGMEVITPRPGCTTAHAVVRDCVSAMRLFYQVPGADGRTSLWRQVDDPAIPAAQRRELLLDSIKRLTFSAQSEGALRINLVLSEGAEEYALVTTVRLRNIAAAERVW